MPTRPPAALPPLLLDGMLHYVNYYPTWIYIYTHRTPNGNAPSGRVYILCGRNQNLFGGRVHTICHPPKFWPHSVLIIKEETPSALCRRWVKRLKTKLYTKNTAPFFPYHEIIILWLLFISREGQKQLTSLITCKLSLPFLTINDHLKFKGLAFSHIHSHHVQYNFFQQ